ncbi:uncharacterized protein LOC125952360 [Anopheles darlingi]|uniref:uncharacterized protein LOC125952360 n=1 Tax=Anopheles darlingi TaxID=43151 RepID=UPI00210018D1|nr:uncharacterized protein LOC125952360 [Anopheles darlingi]
MEDLKKYIRAVMISNTRKLMTVEHLMADFKLMEGENIPYQQFGFKTLEDLLRAMPDVLQVQGYGRQATLKPIITQKSQYMRELVEKNKSTPQGNSNWNKQNIPVRRQPMTWEKHNDFGMNNNAVRSGEPKKNNFYHNPATDKNARRMIEMVAKNVERLTSEAAVYANNDQISNATNTIKKEVSEKESDGKYDGSKLLPVSFTSPTASCQKDTTERNEEFIDKIDSFEPLLPFVENESLVPAICLSPVSNLHGIYVQLQQNTAKLHTMSLQMESIYGKRTCTGDMNGAKHKDKHIRLGKYCSVRNNEDWFRGLVLSRPDGGLVKVYFIDFGVVNLIPKSNVFHLPNHFRFPKQLVRVTMGDIQPIGDRWSEGALRFINQTLECKRIHLLIRAIDAKTNTLDAVLIDTSGPDDVILSRELVRRREAIWT